jgi:hypothetical protein
MGASPGIGTRFTNLSSLRHFLLQPFFYHSEIYKGRNWLDVAGEGLGDFRDVVNPGFKILGKKRE